MKCTCGRREAEAQLRMGARAGEHVCYPCWYDAMRLIPVPALPTDERRASDDDGRDEYAGEDDDRGPELATDGPRWSER